MEVKQFYDEGLAHASYAILSEGKAALIDPGRDPQPYIDFINANDAKLEAVLETHPHADFVSCHLELIKKYGVKVYVNSKVGVSYDHVPFDDGQELTIGSVKLKAVFTPGHSPDHNTYLLYDEQGNEQAVFTGDSLFVGDVGRPDLRENAGSFNLDRETLSSQMYDTVHDFFMKLNDDIMVYPAHGAGSSCGKNMIEGETFSTIGKEKGRNWSMLENDKESFISNLLSDQPDVPKYFPYDVEENRKGVQDYQEALTGINYLDDNAVLDDNALIIDVRPSEVFKEGHLNSAINIPLGNKFESWLGHLFSPEEKLYMVADDKGTLEEALQKTAKIGYEKLLIGVKVLSEKDKQVQSLKLTDDELSNINSEGNTIVDLRNENEVEEKQIFPHAINIPLSKIKDSQDLISSSGPVFVHCAGGYRSAIGSSILESAGFEEVYDIGEKINAYSEA